MFNQNIRALKISLFCATVLTLSGCKTALKHLDVAGTQEASVVSENTITVEELLSQARDQGPSSNSDKNLYLRFKPSHQHLNAAQTESLLKFANRHKAPLLLACAPSEHEDKYTAASIAIKRCNNISHILGMQSFKSEVILAPELLTDQVRVYL